MELRQLEYFLAVVEEGSFTRAAARLYMAQSSLSASLLALERELGSELFIRGRRGTELTDAGGAFLDPVRAALAEAENARDAVAAVTGLLRGSVRIAALATPRNVDVAETIRRFQREHPGVDVHVLPAGARDLVDLVTDGDVDFAICPRTPLMSPLIRFEPLVSTPLVLACPAGHRLAGARDVEMSDVLDELIIDLPRGWHARELFDGMLEEQGLRRHIRLEIHEWLSALTMVQRGTAISYGPLACIDRNLFRGVEVATLAGARMWELGIAARDDGPRGAAGRAFLAAYRRQCRDLGRPGRPAEPCPDPGTAVAS
ncbi:MAG: LysR family transcriptional regulator [Frankiaceae bacterium]